VGRTGKEKDKDVKGGSEKGQWKRILLVEDG